MQLSWKPRGREDLQKHLRGDAPEEWRGALLHIRLLVLLPNALFPLLGMEAYTYSLRTEQWRLEDRVSEVSLNYTAGLKPAHTTWDPVSNKQKRKASPLSLPGLSETAMDSNASVHWSCCTRERMCSQILPSKLDLLCSAQLNPAQLGLAFFYSFLIRLGTYPYSKAEWGNPVRGKGSQEQAKKSKTPPTHIFPLLEIPQEHQALQP